MTRIVVVGDAMLDRDLEGSAERLCPEGPVPVVDEPVAATRPGGAGLAAVLAARDGHEVALVAAVADDDPGRELRRLLDDAGVELVNLGLEGSTPEKTRIRASGHLVARLDRGGGEPGPATLRSITAVRSADAVLVSDYGRGLAADTALRRAASAAALLVWDPHPRGAEPVAEATLATPNRAEAVHVLGRSIRGLVAAAEAAGELRARWAAHAVAVTMSEHGAVLARRGEAPLFVPAQPVPGADPCGAGDMLAATVTALLASGADLDDALRAAVARATDHVARRAPKARAAAGRGAEALVAEVRARGGTVVATGGCFDLLHAGHVEMLRAARRLGDCLVVCLNSDDSVRRLKGPDRPLSPQEDRAAVLLALESVDGVALFDDDTPAGLLERLRPDVFVKGADYARDELPEARVVERWGGRVALVPFVAGRSTSELISRARLNAVA